MAARAFVASTAADFGPTALGSEGVACSMVPEFGWLTVSALAGPATVAMMPPAAATVAAPFMTGWADSLARSLSSWRGLCRPGARWRPAERLVVTWYLGGRLRS